MVLLLCTGSCTWMDSDTASFFKGEKVMTRNQAISYIETAVYANMATCPANEAPGLFAVTKSLPEELDRSFYYVSNLEVCFIAVLAAPCLTTTPTENQIANLYRAIVRTCNPGPA